MTRNFVIIIALAAVVIVIASVSLRVFNPSLLGNLSTPSKQTSSTKSNSSISKPSNQQTGSVPVDPNNAKVSSAKITYSFKAAKLTKITANGKGGLQLNTSLKPNGVNANIVADSKTLIVFIDKNNKETTASLQDLKVGQGVRVVVEYDLRKNYWITKKVGIVQDTASSPQPTASPKK